MTAPQTAPPAAATAPERHYGWSVLVSGFARGLRGAPLFAGVVVGHAALQALLAMPYAGPGVTVTGLLLALASLVVLLAAGALVTAGALATVTGRATWAAAVATVRRHGLAFTGWAVGLLAALWLGLALWTVPAVLVAAATPYLLLAALDGRRNPLAADLRAIGARPGRWLLTTVVMALVVLVSWLLAALSAFFITGVVSALVVWLWFGFLAVWFQCSWAVLYRSTPVGAPAGTPAGSGSAGS